MTDFYKNFSDRGIGHDQYPDLTTEITVINLYNSIKIEFNAF